MFINGIKTMLENEIAVTENGAVGYKTTGKELLDLNFAVSSLRSAGIDDIVNRFSKAYYSDKLMALKWLFYARDARQGLGERRLFRIAFSYLCIQHPQMAEPLIDMVVEYGRYDDLWCLLGGIHTDKIIGIISYQLGSDVMAMAKGESISLIGKWLPSCNASSVETKKMGRFICKKLGWTEAQYRKLLTRLRSYLNVVEVKMSDKKWEDIDYSAVPSRANLIYNSAFLRNDEERRRKFLEKVENGEEKINAGVLFPHDIVHKYCNDRRCFDFDAGLEAMWKALPNIVEGNGNTIVVADGSGSMEYTIGKTNVSALSVANALAIYFAERSSGQFADKYITFSETPQLVDLSKGGNLKEKIEIAMLHNEVANTNIEAVFELILKTAINGGMKQSDLPSNVLIISDMEFDGCAVAGVMKKDKWGYKEYEDVTEKLFDVISKKYADAGYELPRLVFWNVNSRTGTIPITQNNLGVALVSGFSTNVVKLVMSNTTDPYDCLLEALNCERYQPIEDAFNSVK